MSKPASLRPAPARARRFARSIALACLLAPGVALAQDDNGGLPAAPAAPADGGDALPLRDLRLFVDVFNQIRNSYVEEVDDRTLLESAIKGMLSGLDPHSSYLDAEAFADLQENTSGEFGGVGLEVGLDDGMVRVISAIDDTPAKAAGIESGDLIIRLDGKSLKGTSLNDAVTAMRGPKGSKIELTIVREGAPAPLEITLVRDVIKVRSVRSRLLDPGFGYIRIAQFQNESGADVRKALERLRTENAGELRGLVLDLRNNPGGVLQASIEISDAFLEDGLIVYTEGRVENARSRFSATPGDLLDGAPIAVLVNGGSASASEIVAGALQDHRRAVVIGTDSFGKGSVQTVIPLGKDRAVKLTTARYFTPGGRSIQAQGIKPDIVVQRARIEALDPGVAPLTEADLARHLKNGNGTPGESTGRDRKQAGATPDARNDDNQLYEALDVLRAVALLREPPAAGTSAAADAADP